MERDHDTDSAKKPLDLSAVERTLRQAIGVSIPALQEDIAAKLKDPLLGFDVHPDLKFKDAKRKFKEEYIRTVLQKNFGNISEAARLLSLSRRTVHRLSHEEEVARIRDEMAPARYFKQQEITLAISDVLREYADVIHPKRIEQVYEKMPQLSAELLADIEEKPMPLRDALVEFERRYLAFAVGRHGPLLKAVAKATGLRYETLLRKLKAYGIRVTQ